MGKIVRLTESDLILVVKRIIKEQGLIGGLVKAATKSTAKQTGKQVSKPIAKASIPLLQQLPNEIQILIKRLPTSTPVGPKLSNVFKNNYATIRSLPNNVKSLGFDDLYARKLADSVSKTEGTVVDFQDVYTNAHLLKKQLESAQAPYQVQTSINRFISDLESLIKK